MLLIDSHEPKSIIEKLQSAISTKVLRLKYGDYSFSDIVIERKTLSDFFLSIKGDRLKEQMESIDRYYTEKYLLIEGFFDFSYVNNIDYLYSKLNEIILNYDIRLIFSKDCDCTASIIKKLYFNKNLGYVSDVAKRDRIYHAVKFFQIRRDRLEILFSKFGSIKNIVNAEKRDFKGIKSIGKRTVEKFKSMLEKNIFEGE